MRYSFWQWYGWLFLLSGTTGCPPWRTANDFEASLSLSLGTAPFVHLRSSLPGLNWCSFILFFAPSLSIPSRSTPNSPLWNSFRCHRFRLTSITNQMSLSQDPEILQIAQVEIQSMVGFVLFSKHILIFTSTQYRQTRLWLHKYRIYVTTTIDGSEISSIIDAGRSFSHQHLHKTLCLGNWASITHLWKAT